MTERQLSHCITGETGIIAKVDHDAKISTRLQELGVFPGQWVRIVRAGNPIIFQVGDSRFCVRTNQLHGVFVHPLPKEVKPTSCEPVASFSEELSSASSVQHD